MKLKALGIETDGAPGFTLLELIISLTILAVILLIIFSGLRLGLRAWDRGEKDLDLNQRERIGMEMIQHQLASFEFHELSDSLRDLKSGSNIYFQGNSTSMAFFSALPLMPGERSGLVLVHYLIVEEDGKAGIYIREKGSSQVKKEDLHGEDQVRDDLVPLITGLDKIYFEYLKKGKTKEESLWQDSWDPKEEKGYPLAVRVGIVDSRYDDPMVVMARLRGQDG